MERIKKFKEKLQNNRLIIVSNREPYSHIFKNSKIEIKENVGGLTSSLNSLMKNLGKGLWVAWGSTDADFEVTENGKVKVPDENGYFLKRVKLTPEEIQHYYVGFSNSVLWPNCHLFSDKCLFSEEDWQSYKKVNQKFASEILEEIDEKDLIWIQDYHLSLVPKYIKEKKNDSKIAMFWHIPFPPCEIFVHLCVHWRKEIIEGMLSSDLIGFQTKNYAENFMDTAEKIVGAKKTNNGLEFNNRRIKIKHFPIGIEYEKFNTFLSDEEVTKLKKEQHLDDKLVILSVDRLDYTKGILEKLWAIRNLLEQNENLRDKIIFIQIAVPSRTEVEEYQSSKNKIDRLVSEINSKFRDSTTGLAPVRYFYKSFNSKELINYYNLADIALITTLADGMNLVAKEFVAASRNGVLILSENAGAAEQLKEAIIVNPRDIPEIVRAIKKAIDMPLHEKLRRLNKLKENVKEQDIWYWLNIFFTNWLESPSFDIE